jgi:hypothetical protein
MSEGHAGWAWFEPSPRVDEAEGVALARAAAACFAGAEGERLLAHLRALTLDRACGPDAPDALLRHVEGQRALVAHLAALIERGRGAG